MQTVNLYIKTSIKGPKRKAGAYQYLLNTETSKGPYEKMQMKTLSVSTEHQLTLSALLEALERINRPCKLHVYLEDIYVANGLTKWATKWAQNGWRNAKGKDVADADKWQQVLELLAEHELTVHIKEAHSYKEWMRWQLEKKEDDENV